MTYENNPMEESKVLSIPITDIQLPIWSERIKSEYHIIPLRFKQTNESMFMNIDVRC